MSQQQQIDYWEVSPNSQSAVMGDFKKTNVGSLISLIGLKWTQIEADEIASFRITPIASIKIGVSKKKQEKELIQISKKLSQTLFQIIKENIESLPVEELDNFDLKSRLSAWLEIRRINNTKFTEVIESLGVNKTTTIDYLNLQALGIKDYQKILADKYNAKPLTIRDRIAYARRHKWISSVGHGERTAEMTRLVK